MRPLVSLIGLTIVWVMLINPLLARFASIFNWMLPN
jgi:hypothetical protein